jgi:DNA segregation ATPase FtsK/SpoIIIE, S-DNA-T family
VTTPRRRASNARPRGRQTANRRRTAGSGLPHLSPEVTRSLVAIVLMVTGAILLVGLTLPGKGNLTDMMVRWIAPWFGSLRWLLPLVLIGMGALLERGRFAGWGRAVGGVALAFVAAQAALATLVAMGYFLNETTGRPERAGGWIGKVLADALGGAVSRPGSLIVFGALILVGLAIALDRPVRDLLAPVGRGARAVGSAVTSVPLPPATPAATTVESRRARAAADSPPTEAARSGLRGRFGRGGKDPARPEIPSPIEGPSVVSSIFSGGGAAPVANPVAPPTSVAPAPAPSAGSNGRAPSGSGDAEDDRRPAAPVRHEYALPPLALLEDVAARATDRGMDHERNTQIIVGKLASFNIPARVVKWNAGPVVTQYEVESDPSIKVSRIAGLADDLAMALAARTIRIEAPIPGKSVVGIEIPNADFNVVAIRRILEDADVRAITSRIAFALGRDVAGHARAADLARMPHLLIAGATGSGKSVMVNAVIASLLMRATPDEVRMILVDPKRVELADYNGIPHLLVPVITEADRARAALKWAVNEMEMRYRRFAGASARNITAYNETRVDPADRLPYLVIIIDELADLMMRDGRQIEDPIVQLAQKARATGIHLILATQRPSVNVVTGLIKANFPSRIAFAMASQIDSRTILDAPGAEDLIGRGDMLFQPSDLPRPIRLQGVFVSDREVRAITAHWRAEGQPHYDLSIVEDEEDSTGSVDDLPDEEADRLLLDAVNVVQEYDRASASLLQRRLKIGYARAARIIDQLESRGYIGSFDGSNARQVLRREAATPAKHGREDDEAET